MTNDSRKNHERLVRALGLPVSLDGLTGFSIGDPRLFSMVIDLIEERERAEVADAKLAAANGLLRRWLRSIHVAPGCARDTLDFLESQPR